MVAHFENRKEDLLPASLIQEIMEGDERRAFSAALTDLLARITGELAYDPLGMRRLFAQSGDGVDAASEAMLAAEISEDSRMLLRKGRPDLTIESMVVDPQWEPLFTKHERDIARKRLRHGAV